MKTCHLLLPIGLLGLMGCGSESSFTVANTDPVSLKNSPAGLSVFGFLDILTTTPGVLGGSYPSCITPTVTGPTAFSLVFNGCTSSTGGTQTGTLTLADAPVSGVHNYVETFAGLVTTLSPTLQWSYTGKLDVTVNGNNATLNPEDGFKLTVTDTATPANSKVWVFAGSLTSLTTAGGFSLQGTYTFTSGTTDAVSVQIDPQTPLTWVNGKSAPVSGKLTIADNRAGQVKPATVTALFAPGQVTINGGVITLSN